MKTTLSIMCAIALMVTSAAAGPPKPTVTQFFQSEIAGVSWQSDASGSALFILSIPDSAPDVMYAEAQFPNPDDPKQIEVLRKKVEKKDHQASFEGGRRMKWKRATYTYTLGIFSDQDYMHEIGRHQQRAQIRRPLDSVLSEMRE